MLGRQEGPDPLDIAITSLITDMQSHDPSTEQYKDMMNQLERLHKLKGEHHRKRVSPDTLAIVIGNIVGILIIVGYERGHVMTTRAWDYIKRT